jgi:uncharacterized protein
MSTDTSQNFEREDAASGWARFWNRGGWWRAVLVTVAYAAIYQGLGFVIGLIFGGFTDDENPLSNPLSVFFGIALPIILGGLVLIAFAASVGWLTPLLRGRQPVAGRPWMWVAVALVVIPIIMRLFAAEWSAYSATLVLSILFLGLCVGFTEELLTRGINVNLLRRGGHSERVVLVVSSALFAILHSTNVFSGQPPLSVAFTVLYTFGFGAMMYLSLRVTGRLVWAMLLHAATDPTTILATGGIDAHGEVGGSDALISAAGVFNVVYIFAALIAIFLVKGRAASADRR